MSQAPHATDDTSSEARTTEAAPTHICPVWMGWLLASPVRRLVERPERLLAPWLAPGDQVIDVGSAMGFYSLALARLVGPEGRVVALDVQEPMLARLRRRADRKGLGGIVETRLCSQNGLGIEDLEGRAALVIAIHVVHEMVSPLTVLRECVASLRPGGHLLIAEPRGHVSPAQLARTLEAARSLGLNEVQAPSIWRSTCGMLQRP